MRFGVNDGALVAFERAGIKPIGLVRGYNPPGVGVPSAFPGPDAQTTTGGAARIVSIRPSVPDVISGKLDAELKAFFATVPETALVTLWHEGEGARFGFEPVQLIDMHQHAMDLFVDSAPESARYGQIFMTYSASPQGRGIANFVSPYLDFYGLDAYGDGTNTPQDVIPPAVEALEQSQGATFSDYIITESNTPNPEQAADWHSRAFRLARDMRCLAYVPYFGEGTGSQIFNPSDAALVETLKEAAALA